jgi:hypothetical protein
VATVVRGKPFGEDLLARLEAVGEEAAAIRAEERVAGVVDPQLGSARVGRGRRVAAEGLNQCLEDEAIRCVVLSGEASVVADVAVGKQVAVRPAVVARCSLAHVGLGQEVADRVGEIRVLIEKGEKWRKHPLRELVDEVVAPDVPGGVREEAVREGEDLQTLGFGEERIALGGPGHVEDTLQPDRIVGGMQYLLAHDDVGEAVPTH